MTSGRRVADQTRLIQTYTEYPDGSQANFGTASVGGYYAKTWSGTDSPTAKPLVGYTYWREPDWFTANVSKSLAGKARGKPVKHKGRLHKRKISGEGPRSAAQHTYSATIQSYHYVTAVIKNLNGSGIETSRDVHSTLNLRSPIGNALNYVDANDRIAIVGKLGNKVRGSEFNAGVFLAEAGQAIQMIGDAAIRINRAVSYVRKGNVIQAAEALAKSPHDWVTHGRQRARAVFSPKGRSTVASNWLELQYGWLPLLSDIKAAAEFAAKAMNFPYVQKYRVRSEKALVYSPPGIWKESRYGLDCLQIVAFITEVDVPQLVGLTDPASVAWEKLPWSFVVDWVLPVGNWLSARGAASSLKGTFVTTRYLKEFCAFTGPEWQNNVAGQTTLYPDGAATGTYRSIDRVISNSLSDDLPLPTVKTLAQAASWQHAANGIALLTQAFSR